MPTPRVSVLIPAYNCEPFIAQTIESVLNQSFADFELIIVDDASTDQTPAIAARYAGDPRVRLFNNPINLGMVRNWNTCALYAQGDYLKYLCADDYFEPDLLDVYVRIMDDNDDVSLVTSARQVLGEDGVVNRLPPWFVGKRTGEQAYQDAVKHEGGNPIGEPTTVMFRRRDLTYGLFNTDLTWLPDLDYWLRLCQAGSIYSVDRHLSVFRSHQAQMTVVMKSSIQHFEEELSLVFYERFIRRRISANKETYRHGAEVCLYRCLSDGGIGYGAALLAARQRSIARSIATPAWVAWVALRSALSRRLSGGR